MTRWTIEYEGEAFARFFFSLGDYEQAVLTAAIEHVLAVHGIDICNGEWASPCSAGSTSSAFARHFTQSSLRRTRPCPRILSPLTEW